MCFKTDVFDAESNNNPQRINTSNNNEEESSEEFTEHLEQQLQLARQLPVENVKLQAINLTPPPKQKILFVSHFFVSTDVNMMLDVADEMSARNHECYFIVMEKFVKRVEERGYPAMASPNITENLQHAFQFTAQDWTFLSYIRKYIYTILPIASKYYEPSLVTVKHWIETFGKPNVMFISKASESAADVAWYYNIPLAVLFSSPLGSMAQSYEDCLDGPDSNLWGSRQEHRYMWPRMRKFLARFISLVSLPGFLAGMEIMAARYKHGFDLLVFPGDHWKKAAIISPWSMGIDLARPIRPLTFLVGFLTTPFTVATPPTTTTNNDINTTTSTTSNDGEENDSSNGQQQLATQRKQRRYSQPQLNQKDVEYQQYLESKTSGVVFCAFGSLVVLTQEWFDEIVLGMDQWVQAQDDTAGAIITVNSQSLQSGLDLSSIASKTSSGILLVNKENPSIIQNQNSSTTKNIIITTDWVNQKMILQHSNTKVFITHGGLASLSEAIHNIVPMLIVPFFFDQPNNAYRCEEAGIALKYHYRDERIVASKVSQRLRKLSVRKNNKFVQNLIQQYQISVRAGGVGKIGDILEDILLQGDNLNHLIPIGERDDAIPFWAKYHLDILCLMIFMGMFCAFVGVSFLVAYEQEIEDLLNEHVPFLLPKINTFLNEYVRFLAPSSLLRDIQEF